MSRGDYAPGRAPGTDLVAEPAQGPQPLPGVGPDLLRAHAVVANVPVAVEGDLVPLRHRPAQKPGVARGEGRHDEERGPRTRLPQRVQHARRPDGVRSVVERQRDVPGQARPLRFVVGDGSTHLDQV